MLLYSLKLFLIGLLTLVLGIPVIILGPFDRSGKLTYKVLLLWGRTILKISGIRLRIEGTSRLDPERQYIFMANHQSNVDIPILLQSLAPFRLRWAAKKELLYVPFFGCVLLATRQVMIDRSDRLGAIASLRNAQRRIEGGISVVFFPEGTRSTNGKLLPFKRGGFVLAVRSKTPIVPVSINGSGKILPKGGWRIHGGEVEVVISEPVFMEDHQAESIPELLMHVRRVIESHMPPDAEPRGGEPLHAHDAIEEVRKNSWSR